MAAKNKSIQATDEPVVVEEVQPAEEIEQTDSSSQSNSETTDTPATDTSAQPGADVADSSDASNTPETEQQPEMEQHDTEQTQIPKANDFFGAPPEPPKGGIPKVLIAVILLVVAGGAASFMFLGGPGKFLGASVEATPSPFTEEIPAPEPSPEAEDVNLTEFSVRVLNGTGTGGEAGKVKVLLEEAGFEEIKTGNAPSEDNTVTTISAKAEVPTSAVKAIENALKGTFTTEAGDTLGEDSDYDIVVTTGGASAKDATGSAEKE